MIIGLTGKIGSGKGEVVNYLKTKGYEHYVYSDVIREIAKQRGIEPTRANLQRLGFEIKRKKGYGVLSSILLKKAKTQNAVFDGIRNRYEINELRKKNTLIIGVTASPKVRFERIRKRNRKGDPKTYHEFKRLDNIENRGKTIGQEINHCLTMADNIIDNNSTLVELHKKIDAIISRK